MSTPLQDKFLSAVETSGRRNTPAEPWNHLTEAYRTFDAVKYGHPLRQNSMTPRVMRYNAYIEAAGLYNRINYPATTAPFRLVEKRNGTSLEVMLEGKNSDGSRLLIVNDGASVRMSMIDITGNAWQVPRFQDMGNDYLRWLSLTFIPHVLRLDVRHGNRIRAAIKTLSKGAEDSMAQPWQSADEIPDMVKDAAYYMDVFHVVLKHHMTIDFGMTGSDQPAEIDDGRFNNTSGFHGELLAEFVPDPSNWEPAYVKAVGVGRRFAGNGVNFAEAKAQYSSYTAHRNWSAAERDLIPKFEDDTPVPQDVLYFAKQIVATKGNCNPVIQFMWRGPTGVGKSYGTRMLAGILNIPYLVFTCHTRTETEDFFSKIVPDGKTEHLPVNMDNLLSMPTMQSNRPKPPFYDEASGFFNSLSHEEKEELLDTSRFFTDAAMDADFACERLLGRVEPNLFFSDLLWLYNELTYTIETATMKNKIAELEAAKPSADGKKDMSFIHVLSSYMKAITNGYLCEVQECSRIKDAGALVGLNELSEIGGMKELANGYTARRHADTLIVFTDNVGYDSCRPIDPSVLRRMAFIRDAGEITKDDLYERAKRNTGVNDTAMLDRCYAVWEAAKNCCTNSQITEGSISPVEFTNLVQMVNINGIAEFDQCVYDCIISKASSDPSDQKEILAACSTVM